MAVEVQGVQILTIRLEWKISKFSEMPENFSTTRKMEVESSELVFMPDRKFTLSVSRHSKYNCKFYINSLNTVTSNLLINYELCLIDRCGQEQLAESNSLMFKPNDKWIYVTSLDVGESDLLPEDTLTIRCTLSAKLDSEAFQGSTHTEGCRMNVLDQGTQTEEFHYSCNKCTARANAYDDYDNYPDDNDYEDIYDDYDDHHDDNDYQEEYDDYDDYRCEEEYANTYDDYDNYRDDDEYQDTHEDYDDNRNDEECENVYDDYDDLRCEEEEYENACDDYDNYPDYDDNEIVETRSLKTVEQQGTQTEESKSSVADASKLLNTLSSDYGKFYKNDADPDCVLKVGGVRFNVHRTVLSARSSVFAAMFHLNMSEKSNGEAEIKDVEADTLSDVLHYIYCGEIRGLTTDTAVSMFTVADKYALLELREVCLEFLMQNLTFENVYDAALLAHTHEEASLENKVALFIDANIKVVVDSDEWKEFSAVKPAAVNKILQAAYLLRVK